jgi:putative transcriptional regulator
MPGDFAPTNLTNHFLIAMPALNDAIFTRSVVYVCEHTARGALGLIINKPGALPMTQLFEKINLPLAHTTLSKAPVFQGGPVQTERGFVLHHSPAAQGDGAREAGVGYAATLAISGGLQMTTSKDVLDALSTGAGPAQAMIFLGYSAWGEGQLESELARNSWLTVAADRRVIFDTPVADRYEQAVALLGFESWMLSPDVGHA